MIDYNTPIIFLSVFKSGTHLMRQIIEDLTGLPYLEPEIIPGKVNYQDTDQLFRVVDHFYSWHLYPTDAVREKIKSMKARPILLLRNMYDLAVSMYYHFSNNIDADIGRGRNVDHYFQEMNKKKGLEAIIKGFQKPDFNWKGIGSHLHQMELMFTLANEHPCFITTFERLICNKVYEIKKLSKFLYLDINKNDLLKTSSESDFEVMKSRAIAKGIGSHYRQGQKNSHIKELDFDHIHLIQTALVQHAPDLKRMALKEGFEEIIVSPLLKP